LENPARTLILPQQKPFEALYVHIPFCKSKCAYCDFESRAISCESPEITQYVDSLILDIRAASKADLLGSTKTVYIGGGTPTHIGNKDAFNT
jgi:oxygen-independent coproporphyrinogen-3 oxidase